MDTSKPASDPSLTKDTLAQNAAGAASPRPRRSRVTSQALAELWTPPGTAEAVALPKNLKSLGEALRHALASGGALGKAYVALADEAMGHPASLPAFADFMVRLFAGEPMALINLVRTQDLIAELEHGGSRLTRMVALRWVAGSMAQKISRFGESLANYKERLRNPVAAEVMAAFAGLLALSKPGKAAGLFQLATGITSQPGDADFVEDVRVWLAAGELINPMSPVDRAFWQECLHHADDVDWAGTEARGALDALASRLKTSMACAGLFEHIVPRAWWDQHMRGQGREPAPKAKAEPESAPVKEEPSAVTAALPGFATEEPVEKASPPPKKKDEAASTVSRPEAVKAEPAPAKKEPAPPKSEPVFVKMESVAAKDEPAADKPAKPAATPAPNKPLVPLRTGPAAKPASAAPAPTVAVPSSGIRPFLFGQVLGMAIVAGAWIIQPDLLPRALGVAGGHWFGGKPSGPVAAPTPASGQAAAAVATTSTTAPVPAAASLTERAPVPASAAAPGAGSSSGDKWRSEQVADLYARHRAMRLWVSKAQEATSWPECAMLLEGRYPVAYPTVEDYQVFLKWLMLDPPRNEVVRHAVPKLYVHASSIPDFLDLCEHLSYPGSVTRPDIPFIAQLALDIHVSGLTTDQRNRLKKLAALQ